MKTQILILAAFLVLSTQSWAQKTDYLVGAKTKVTCSLEEADKNYLKMGNEAEDPAVHKANVYKAGDALSDKLSTLIFDKKIRSHRMPIEIEDDIKMAVCFTQRLITKAAPTSDFEARFKENLEILEDSLQMNKEDYAKGDSLSLEEQNDIDMNEVLYANRGAIAFIEAVFGLSNSKK